jgi:AcrR family transcriptional regulator
MLSLSTLLSKMPMASHSTRETYHHGNLRSALIEAGMRLLRDHGVADLSLRAVAKAAGVSHAAPYRHFRDKSGLLSAIVTVGFEELTEAMSAAAKRHPHDPAKQLVEAGVAYVLVAIRNPERVQLMFGGAVDFQADEELTLASQRAFDSVVQIVDNGLRAGVYAPGDAVKLAWSNWALVHGLANLIIAGRLKEVARRRRRR